MSILSKIVNFLTTKEERLRIVSLCLAGGLILLARSFRIIYVGSVMPGAGPQWILWNHGIDAFTVHFWIVSFAYVAFTIFGSSRIAGRVGLKRQTICVAALPLMVLMFLVIARALEPNIQY